MRQRTTRARWNIWSALLLVVALAVAACAPQSADTTGSTNTTAAVDAGTNLGDTLNIATWPNYHDPETIKRFTAETGVNVNISVFGSTEEMEALLRAGNSGMDIVVPTHYAVPGWIADGLIEPLDYAKMGNPDLSGWNPLFIDQPFDPGNRYSIPKNWGTTGIIYSPAVGDPVTSWSEFFDRAKTDLDGRAVIVDHQISTIGSAAVAMGYDLNTTDPDELAKIEAMLVELKPHLWAITSDVQPAIRNGDSWVSMAWTGDGVQVVRDNPDFVYVIPDDGGELWVDNWTVAADAPHRDAAYAFLEFILRPENSAADTAFILFPHANPAVLPFLPADVANNPVIYPDQEAISRMTLSSAEAYNSEARAEMWARVKSSS
ncbi:MAG: spermidine/putrescine ABC transporter substrate-binding protein [Actinobacteria bacterium]|nr:spermidine/putrescine ABC transporter substrate-binding protein [Actinomycetota bacterium]